MAILTDFVKELKKKEVPCFIALINDRQGKPKFIEVIVKRSNRYTEKGIMKRIPKSWKGIRVKAL